MKTITKQKLSLLPAFLFLFTAMLTSSFALAQHHHEETTQTKVIVKTEDVNAIKKTIKITQENGESVVTITTEKNGEVTIEKYTGEEAEQYMAEHAKHTGTTTKKIIIEDFDIDDSDAETHTMHWTTSSDENQSATIKIIKMDGDSSIGISMNDINIDVTDSNDNKVIVMKFVDENGKSQVKTMVINEEDIEKNMKYIDDVLENMEIEVEVSEEMDDSNKVQKIVMVKTVAFEMEDDSAEGHSSTIFDNLKVTPNKSDGILQIQFTPKTKGTVEISVQDGEGAVLFTDSYNGKSEYSKNISVGNLYGTYIVKIEQGNEVEVRKLKIK